jgi:monoamine oxidase
MAPRISQALLVISGVLTGITTIAIISYYNKQKTDTTSNTATSNGIRRTNTVDTTAATTASLATPNGRTNRLRRSQPVRRRRNRTSPENNEAEPSASLSETEDADNRRMLELFKEWGDDDNRNLLNLLHAISENQSRKGKVSQRKICRNYLFFFFLIEGYIHRT